MTILTNEQLHEIREIIQRHHLAVIAGVFGPGSLSSAEREALERVGMLEEDLAGLDDAYLVGRSIGILESGASAEMTYGEFKQYIDKNPIELSDVEERAAEMAEHQAAEYIRGLGGRIATQTGRLMTEAEEQAVIRERVATTVERRESVSKLKSDLGKMTGDWSRDWDRVAVTELHGAMQKGTADSYRDEFGDDVLVFKRALPGSCKWCQKLHTGPDGAPRIFKLSTLRENGTNVGRKAADWLAVEGTIHPWCHPGGTRVLTPDGNVPIETIANGSLVLTHTGSFQRATRMSRLYEGPLLRIKTERGTIEATPNHPLLTCSGWSPAESLKLGQHLVSVDPDVISSLLVERKTEQGPALRLENSLFARIVFLFSGGGVPVAAIDFNGQLFVFKREVDVKGSDCERGGWAQPYVEQRGEHLVLVGRLGGALHGSGSSGALFEALCPTPGGFVCGASQPLPILDGTPKIPEVLRSTIASLFEASGSNPASNQTPITTESTGYLLHGEQFVKVHPDNSFDFYVVAWAAHARILDIEQRHVKMQVYNLSVENSQSFVANGHISHNCQCVLMRVPVGWGFDEEGELVPGGQLGIRHEDEPELARSFEAEDQLRKSSRMTHQGLRIVIENPAGSVRKWTDQQTGETGETVMRVPYGYIEGTRGSRAEGKDEYDVFVGPDPFAPFVFIVHQMRKPDFTQWDEDKVLIGVGDPHTAKRLYLAHYDDPRFFGSMTQMPIEEFREKVLRTGEPAQDGMVKSEIFVIPLEEPLEKAEPAYRLVTQPGFEANLIATQSNAKREVITDGAGGLEIKHGVGVGKPARPSKISQAAILERDAEPRRSIVTPKEQVAPELGPPVRAHKQIDYLDPEKDEKEIERKRKALARKMREAQGGALVIPLLPRGDGP